MKNILTILIGLFWTISVYADCAGTGLWVFPSGQTIKQNSIFVLDGYAESQHVILGLNKKHIIYLKSGNKKIKLLVTEICVGQFYLTQAVLKPESELEAGLEYTMYIDSLPEYESFNKYNRTTQKYESVTFKVVAEKDNEKPQLSAKPKELKKTLVHYGCGPSIHVVFNNPAKDNSDIIVKTTVKDLKTGKETTYYIEPDGDKIKVGHGMCSGAFDFEENSNNYEVEFLFMDASGNLTSWTGERMKFTKPTKETNQGTTEKIESVKTDTNQTKITFYKVNGKGILLGDNIKLLDENFKEIKDISYLNEQFVDITEVSDKYYKLKPTDDYCQEFKYVKIKTKDLVGFVDGREIYEPVKNTQNKIVKTDNNEVSFIATSYFGIGVSDDDGLTGCSINTPVVFSDKSANYEGLVKMVKNKNYEDNYPYLELKDDDGANDEILSIDKQGDKYLLKIKRTYQEGGANLIVEVYKDKSGTFIAEIIKNERTEE